jgi:hypothetical protein
MFLAGVNFKPGREAAARQRIAVLAGQGVSPEKWFQDPVIKDAIAPSRTAQDFTKEFQDRVSVAQKRVEAYDTAIRQAAVNNPDAVAGLLQARDRYVLEANKALGKHAASLNEQGVSTKFEGLSVPELDVKTLTARAGRREALTEAQLALAQARLAALKSRGGLTKDDNSVLQFFRNPNYQSLLDQMSPEARVSMMASLEAILKKLGSPVPPKPKEPARQKSWFDRQVQDFLSILGRGTQTPTTPTAPVPTVPDQSDDDLSDLYQDNP